MLRQIKQLDGLAKQYEAPIVIAGDVFDRWNPPPELINFAIEHLPQVYAIPGQHDLPHHNLDDIKRSAFWTLVEAGTIIPAWNYCRVSEALFLHGFPWGAELLSCDRSQEHPGVHVAVVHRYCWVKGHEYRTAPEENHLKNLVAQLEGYDAWVFGDNHSGFVRAKGRAINCGGFLRRSQDSRNSKPMVGLMDDFGRLEPYYLDVDQDQFVDQEESDVELGLSEEFITELKSLSNDPLDFEQSLRNYADTKASGAVKSLLLDALEAEL